MSIITKIRERSGLAVSIVAIALLLFIVGGDLLSGNSTLLGNSQTVGEIGGSDVSYKEYTEKIDQLSQEYVLQNQKQPGEQELQGIREQAWNKLIFEKLFLPEFERDGIVVTDEEIEDMISGNNVHPAIKQAFTNQQTGQFDKTQVIMYLKQLKQVAQKRDNQQAIMQYLTWLNFEKQLPDDRKRQKYEALLSKSVYVTKEEAKREYLGQADKADIEYVFVPYNSITDTTLKPSDEQLKAYFAENKHKYKGQDSRSADYVSFRIEPSAEDAETFKTELEAIKNDFAASTNDTLYARGKSDEDGKLQSLSIGDLPADLANIATTLVKGQVYGPYTVGPKYSLYKVVDVASEGQAFARAAHILFKAGTTPEEKAESKKKAEDILKQIKGGADFAQMAAQHGSDGTAQQGGDLGWFSEGRMVKPFEDAIFKSTKVGLLPNLVETEFGYHIIKITNTPTKLKYKFVTIVKNIEPSEATIEAVYAQASAFKAQAKDEASFNAAVTSLPATATKMSAPTILKNSYNVNDIQEARDLVRWAFDEETPIGAVSAVFNYKDRCVVALLKGKQEENNVTWESVKEPLKNEVLKNLKAERILAKLKAGSDLEAVKSGYGPEAVKNIQNDLNRSSVSIADFGYDPEAVGRAFGLKEGAVSKPFKAESGVGIIKLVKLKPAAEIADYNTYKTQIEQRRSGGVQYYASEAVKQVKTVVDNRIKFF